MSYFACELLMESKTVFDERYLNEKAIRYFERESTSPNRPAILNGLRSTVGNSITKQLITQGLFVIVDRSATSAVYDFPHRRFREELAARYIDERWDADAVVASIDRRDFSEFVLVLFRLGRSQSQVLEAALERAAGPSADREYFGRLASQMIGARPGGYDPTPALERLIIRSLTLRTFFVWTRRP